MHAAGAPPPSKLAFVALMYPQYEVYHFAEHLAPRYGMQAKVFTDVIEAKIWLQAKQRPPLPVPGQSSTTPFPEPVPRR